LYAFKDREREFTEVVIVGCVQNSVDYVSTVAVEKHRKLSFLAFAGPQGKAGPSPGWAS
jgi:hypothetical protein